MQKLKDNYTLYIIENSNKSYRGPLSGPLAFYNSDIDNIFNTFNEIKKEIYKINNNIKRKRLIKIEYVNNKLEQHDRVEAKKTNNAPKYYYGQITSVNKDNTYQIRFDDGMYRSNTPKSQIRESKISDKSLSKIETCIKQLNKDQKKKLANYLYFLSYINNADKEVTFDLEDLEIVCNWLKDTSKDKDLKKKLIQQYNNHTDLRDNLIKIHLILEKERKSQNPYKKNPKPKKKPQNPIIMKFTVNIQNKVDNQKVNTKKSTNPRRNSRNRNRNSRNSNNNSRNSSKPDDKLEKRGLYKRHITENIKLRF